MLAHVLKGSFEFTTVACHLSQDTLFIIVFYLLVFISELKAIDTVAGACNLSDLHHLFLAGFNNNDTWQFKFLVESRQIKTIKVSKSSISKATACQFSWGYVDNEDNSDDSTQYWVIIKRNQVKTKEVNISSKDNQISQMN